MPGDVEGEVEHPVHQKFAGYCGATRGYEGPPDAAGVGERRVARGVVHDGAPSRGCGRQGGTCRWAGAARAVRKGWTEAERPSEWNVVVQVVTPAGPCRAVAAGTYAGGWLAPVGRGAARSGAALATVAAGGVAEQDQFAAEGPQRYLGGVALDALLVGPLAVPRARVPVVALTAQAFAEQIEQCLLAGMDSHLAKPFTPQALLDAVTCAVEMGKARGKASVAPPHATSSYGTSLLVSTVSTLADLELPVLDMAEFDRTAAFLAPEALASYLQTIAGRGTALLDELHASGDLVHAKGTLAESAHTLSGSAGMFGFKRLAAVARRFEHAVQTAAPEASAVALHLSVTIDASLEELRNRVRAVIAATSEDIRL